MHGSNKYYADNRVLIYCIILRLLGQQIKLPKLLHISKLKINCFSSTLLTMQSYNNILNSVFLQ